MPYINIHFKKDLRNVFSKDETVKFDFSDKDTITLAGRNGSGKSTLINCIRNFKCDNFKRKGASESLNKYDNRELRNFVDIDTDFEKIFVFSSEYDDPLSMNNAYDACALFDLGGLGANTVSKGQRFQGAFVRFFESNKKNFENSLVILDEPDNGFDLFTQSKNSSFFIMLPIIDKCKLLLVTHSLITIMRSLWLYDIAKRDYVLPNEFVRNITGFEVSIKRVENEEERKEEGTAP